MIGHRPRGFLSAVIAATAALGALSLSGKETVPPLKKARPDPDDETRQRKRYLQRQARKIQRRG